jgi:alanine racemase
MLRDTEPLRAWVEVDLDALTRNARAIAARAGVPILPMVKADAYGLGALPVVRALERVDPWGYGVATVDEGRALRRAGVARPIVVFNPLLDSEVAVAQAEHLSPVLGDATVIARWAAVNGNAPWHLAIDTGMSRSGIPWSLVGELAALLAQHPPLGVCTHFQSADADDGSERLQLDRFRQALGALPVRPQVLHAENSPAIERLVGGSVWTVVRPGVFLYGVESRDYGREGGAALGGRRQDPPGAAPPPHGQSGAPPLRSLPVVALRARIVELRWIDPGEGVSYGSTFRAAERRRIATLAVGYADGYRRAFSNVGRALVRGQPARVAGVVTMDMTMLDVTGIDCEIGDAATLLGADLAAREQDGGPIGSYGSGHAIDIAAAARAAGLCVYELLTGLRLRAPRVYLDRAPR